MSAEPGYKAIAAHYEACLERHGDNHLGVDWPDPTTVDKRHRVMLDVIRSPGGENPVRLLDVGCGASHLHEYVLRSDIRGIEYAGLDISERFIELSRAKHPEVHYWCVDLLADDARELPRFDYAVMSGIFTEKLELGFDEMFAFVRSLVGRVFD